MNEAYSNIDFELISRYLEGNADKLAIESIEKWISSSEDNRLEFQRLRRLWVESGKLSSKIEADVDVDAGWEAVKNRLHSNGKWKSEIATSAVSAKTSHRYIFYLTRVAAVLVVGLMIYFVYNTISTFSMEISIVAENAVKKDVLPDGSEITLNSATKITYPEKFNRKKREVHLSGEAFFDVERALDKPFIVETKGALIRVLGTSFNVRAREEEGYVEVSVQEGRVELASLDGSLAQVLNTGEKGRLDLSGNVIEESEVLEPNELFWISKTLIFKNTELSMVFETLKEHYDVDIEYKEDQNLDCNITGIFEAYSIDEILKHIAQSCNLEIQKEREKYIITHSGS